MPSKLEAVILQKTLFGEQKNKTGTGRKYLENFYTILVVQMVKNLPAIEETWGSMLGWGRSPGEGNGNLLQYSCLQNSMDRGVWRSMVSQRVRHKSAYTHTHTSFDRILHTLSSVQLLTLVQLIVPTWTAAHQVSLLITNSQSFLKLMSIESIMPTNHLTNCHPLLPLLPSIFPSIRVFPKVTYLTVKCPGCNIKEK